MPTIGDYEDDEDGYLDASLEWLSQAQLGEIVCPGFLTVAQCALLIPAIQNAERSMTARVISEAAADYVMLIQRDIAHSDLQARHPVTLLPYAEYLKMAAAGVYGEDGRAMPMPDMGWLVAFEDAQQWYASKGISVDLAAVLQESRPQKITARRRDAIITGLRELGFEPKSLPKRENGKPWVKAGFWRRFGNKGLFTSEKAFEKAWSELSVSGEIAEGD